MKSFPTLCGILLIQSALGTGAQSIQDREEVCGNSILHDGETCDAGNERVSDGCSATCTLETGYM